MKRKILLISEGMPSLIKQLDIMGEAAGKVLAGMGY